MSSFLVKDKTRKKLICVLSNTFEVFFPTPTVLPTFCMNRSVEQIASSQLDGIQRTSRQDAVVPLSTWYLSAHSERSSSCFPAGKITLSRAQ